MKKELYYPPVSEPTEIALEDRLASSGRLGDLDDTTIYEESFD